VKRLVPQPPGRILGGSVRLGDTNVLALPAEDLVKIRGKEVSMIFQDPMTSLNPVMTVEKQMREVLEYRFGLKKDEARARALEMLKTVGIAEPEARLASYPHELSGGMKQRVMIALALLCEPKLLIADEPTTALDVTIQAQILHLIRDLQQRTNTAVIFITHDMGVVAQMCDDVAVMYAGRVVETASAAAIFGESRHPYTRGLLASIPRKETPRKAELPTIEGVVPSMLNPPKGCRFAERCWMRKSLGDADQRKCFEEDPKLRPVGASEVACHFPVQVGGTVLATPGGVVA
jgi:oligopeptide/dipeptide ABC transporter ATP-binding protein